MTYKYCSIVLENGKHKLSVVEKFTGECKWCKKYFCQQHIAVEHHMCEQYDRKSDILSIKPFVIKTLKSTEKY